MRRLRSRYTRLLELQQFADRPNPLGGYSQDLAVRPRYFPNFTPKHPSWLDQAKSPFGLLQALKHRTCRGVRQLAGQGHAFIAILTDPSFLDSLECPSTRFLPYSTSEASPQTNELGTVGWSCGRDDTATASLRPAALTWTTISHVFRRPTPRRPNLTQM